MNLVVHYIFFDLYGLVFCLDDLYGVFSGFILFLDLRFRNRREKIDRNMLYFLSI
jgi:hypothetical protein